ncbi:MAG: Hsp33 family molecular chaperone HslO [Oscillospiraceae bacterium]|jgi:molecular chaperone Hsp33
MGKLVRSISADGSAVSMAVDSTDIVREMKRCQNTSATASAALGRLLTAAALIGATEKQASDSVTLRIDGGGPIGKLIAVSDGLSNVRGYCDNPQADVPVKRPGKLDVGGLVGKNGTLSVITDMGLKEPYTGSIPLVSGEIAEDITQYFAVSQQTPTVCALGVLVDTDLSIICAGGFMVQLLPGAPERVISAIEQNIKGMSAPTSLFKKGMTPKDISLMALSGLNPNVLDESTAAFKCTCSRKKMADVLRSLGTKELEDMAKEGSAEVVCEFCKKKYMFTPEELRKLEKKSEQDEKYKGGDQTNA